MVRFLHKWPELNLFRLKYYDAAGAENMVGTIKVCDFINLEKL